MSCPAVMCPAVMRVQLSCPAVLRVQLSRCPHPVYSTHQGNVRHTDSHINNVRGFTSKSTLVGVLSLSRDGAEEGRCSGRAAEAMVLSASTFMLVLVAPRYHQGYLGRTYNCTYTFDDCLSVHTHE